VMLRFGTIFTVPIDFTVVFLGAAASAGTATAAATTIASALMARRADLRRDICSFLAASGGIRGPLPS
jgi:hypothetical protein